MLLETVFIASFFATAVLFWLKTSTKLVPRQYQLQKNKSTTSHACRNTGPGQTAAHFRLQLCASSLETKKKTKKVYGMCQKIQLVDTTLKELWLQNLEAASR